VRSLVPWWLICLERVHPSISRFLSWSVTGCPGRDPPSGIPCSLSPSFILATIFSFLSSAAFSHSIVSAFSVALRCSRSPQGPRFFSSSLISVRDAPCYSYPLAALFGCPQCYGCAFLRNSPLLHSWRDAWPCRSPRLRYSIFDCFPFLKPLFVDLLLPGLPPKRPACSLFPLSLLFLSSCSEKRRMSAY